MRKMLAESNYSANAFSKLAEPQKKSGNEKVSFAN